MEKCVRTNCTQRPKLFRVLSHLSAFNILCCKITVTQSINKGAVKAWVYIFIILKTYFIPTYKCFFPTLISHSQPQPLHTTSVGRKYLGSTFTCTTPVSLQRPTSSTFFPSHLDKEESRSKNQLCNSNDSMYGLFLNIIYEQT